MEEFEVRPKEMLEIVRKGDRRGPAVNNEEEAEVWVSANCKIFPYKLLFMNDRGKVVKELIVYGE